ncbi:MAG TPA: hypothetical protein VHA55_14740 [Pseudorhodoplanes sp.]|nr:hypothetical protein [Pseudorhodoplanes sp.]
MRMFLPFALILVLGTGTAGAQDLPRDAVLGRGVICDTSEQALRFVALVNDGVSADNAVRKVNDEAKDDRACGEAVIAFTMDEELGPRDMGGRPVSIVRITVLAISQDGLHWAPIAPKVQYTVLPAKGQEV